MKTPSIKCVPCNDSTIPLGLDQANARMGEVPGWRLLNQGTRLVRHFSCGNFVQALALTQAVGELCEVNDHHADICLGWGYCVITFYTHKINGLHDNDFFMAAQVDSLQAVTQLEQIASCAGHGAS